MRLETFFEKFELFADAPDAMAKMRELVLQLAVRGKLVKQNPDDGDATSLLEAMALVRNANGRRKTGGSADAVELPDPERWHDVPSSWRWVQLGSIGDIVGGGTPRSENSDYFAEKGIPWLTPADLNGFKGKSILRGRRCITQLGLENSSAQLLPEGTVLFSSRAPIGYVAIAGAQLATNQGFKSCIPFVKETNEYLYYYLMGAAARIDSEASGTTFREVSGKIVSQIPVPLPPLAEQRRIVAKVDELMALCDRLEAQQQERETRHAELARASLARFADAPTPANLDLLFHKSYDIKPADLRKSILTLAIQGKLVPQDPNDEPGDAILQRIDAGFLDKKSGTESSVGRKLVTLSFELPTGWAVSRLGSILLPTRGISYGVIKLGAEPQQGGVFILRCSNVRFRRIDLNGIRKVTEQLSSEYGRTILKGGEVLINVRGTLGGCAVVPAEMKGYNIAREVAVIPVHTEIDPTFLLNVIASPYFQDTVDENLRGIAYEGLNLGLLRDFLVPIPPIAEQKRIVAKVDELMALVDQLEEQQAAANTTGGALLEAVIHELLNPTATIIPFPIAERGSLLDRATIGCYAIQRLSDKRTFGRTAAVKVLYMAEAHLGLDLGGRYTRDAAGPLDQWIYKFEEEAARQQWFSVVEGVTKEGHKKIEYRRGPKLSAKAQEASTRLSAAQRSEFDRVLALLAQKPTVEVEIIATLFAAWNDFLIDGRQPNDDEIVQEMRENWHPSKQRFTQAELKTWLAWLRQHALVPQGKGPHTVGQQSKLQLH